MALVENVKDAWSVLFGLKRASMDARADAQPDQIGSPPDAADDTRRVLSAAFEYYRYYTHLEPDRISIYSDMDEMFQYVLVHAGMEAYIEDATQMDNQSGMTIWPKSPNPEVQAELLRLFDNLELEDRIGGDLWGMSKYGDHFGLLRYQKSKGVYDMIPMEPRIVWRQEDTNRVLRGFTVGDSTDAEAQDKAQTPAYKPWDLVHFRIRGKRPTDPYGSPFFLQVRLIYKVLKLMEEQMVIYRMNLHPDRLIFKVFTGSAGPDERNRLVQKWRRSQEKATSFNHDTGRFTSEYAPWMVNQNIYWPVGNNDQVSGVEKFPGSANSGDIFDVEYMRDLLFAGMRIPKAYMGFEDSQGYRGTDTLSSQSIKFARGVKKLQRHLLQGYTRMCRIHLALRGIDSRQPQNSFTLEMTPVSYLDEAHKSELYAKRYEAMDYMLNIGENMVTQLGINQKVWAQYVLKEFGGFDDDMITKLMTPDGQQADMTFTPRGSAFRFEDLTKDQVERIREKVMEDDTLRHYVGALIPNDLDFASSVSSKSDLADLRLEEAGDFSSVNFEKAVESSATAELGKAREAKKRLSTELRAMAEAMLEAHKEDR